MPQFDFVSKGCVQPSQPLLIIIFDFQAFLECLEMRYDNLGETMKTIKNKVIVVLSIVLIASLLFLGYSIWQTTTEKMGFDPPKNETNAIQGVPSQPDESWLAVYKEGMSFSAHVCAEVRVVNRQAQVFFTNDPDNTVWLKLRITDKNNNVIGESGILKPNEYVKEVKLKTNLSKGEVLKLKIMSYEPGTYYSMGAVTVNGIAG